MRRLLRRLLRPDEAGMGPPDAELISESDLFDRQWYLDRHPVLRERGIDPVAHYLSEGADEGHATSPAFDGRAYLELHPDVAAAEQNPLVHYLRYGREEGRSLPASHVAQGEVPDDEPSGPAAHYGRTLDRLLRRAETRRDARAAQLEGYDTLAAGFDHAHYVLRHGDLARARHVDLVHHYMRAGAREGRDPSAEFSTKEYLRRHPELAESDLNPFLHWLTDGRRMGRIASPLTEFEYMAGMLDMAPHDAQDVLSRERADLRDRLASGTLGKMVAQAAELDPLISSTWTEMTRIKLPPFHSDPVVSRVACLHRLQAQAEFARARYVIVVNRPRWGGGRRMEGHLGHALAEMAGASQVAVVTTEESGPMPEGRFPEGVRHIRLSDIAGHLPNDAKQRVLAEFLRSMRPDAVFNVNSRLMWDCMKPYGRALSSSMKLIATLFCNEQTQFGFWTGYPIKRFYRTFDLLDAACPDSRALAEELAERHLVPADQRGRIVVLGGPVDPSIPVPPPPAPEAGRRPKVFWAGRFDRQKRMDVAIAVARATPEIDLHMWGEPVIPGEAPPEAPDNVSFEGPYDSFDELPLDQADLWLYTAEWDGVPSILLEVAMTGLPIVGSRVGGTGEVIRDGSSEPVDDIEDVASYREAILRVLADPDTARERALGLRGQLLGERTAQSYRRSVEEALAQEAPASRERREALRADTPPPAQPAAPGVDLSLVLTVHDETVVSGPTMTSADLAVAQARRAGFTVEQVIALDEATAATADYFSQPAFDHWRRIELQQGDLGRARNEVLGLVSGRNIAFLDADDLFSENWLSEGMGLMVEAEADGRRVIVHPELNWQFDAGHSIFYNRAQDDPLFTPWFLTTMHYYDSLCLAPRTAHEQIRYVSRDIENGLSFQDWQFTVETMDRGWEHLVARDTVIFKRRRDDSLVVESSARKSVLRPLECMAIDRIGQLGRTRPPGS